MKRACPVCERPVTDAVLCQYCTTTVHEALQQMPMLLVELEVTATRQARTAAPSSGGRSAETPLPYGARASDAIRQITGTLITWATTLRVGSWTAPTAAAYLCAHIDQLRQHPMAEKAYEHITKAKAHALEVIDREPELVPAGQCGAELADGDVCGEILYGDPDRASVRCRCGAEWDMDQTWMIESARNQEWTAAEIGRVVPGVTGSMVRDYARRGLVQAVGERVAGPVRVWPTYRVGDVLDARAESMRTRGLKAG